MLAVILNNGFWVKADEIQVSFVHYYDRDDHFENVLLVWKWFNCVSVWTWSLCYKFVLTSVVCLYCWQFSFFFFLLSNQIFYPPEKKVVLACCKISVNVTLTCSFKWKFWTQMLVQRCFKFSLSPNLPVGMNSVMLVKRECHESIPKGLDTRSHVNYSKWYYSQTQTIVLNHCFHCSAECLFNICARGVTK